MQPKNWKILTKNEGRPFPPYIKHANSTVPFSRIFPFKLVHFENTIFGQDFSILTSHKPSLAHVSYFRLLDTNKQTDRQTGKYSIQDIYERGLLNRLRFDNYWFLEGDELLFGACKLLYLSKPTSFPKIRGVYFLKKSIFFPPPF